MNIFSNIVIQGFAANTPQEQNHNNKKYYTFSLVLRIQSVYNNQSYIDVETWDNDIVNDIQIGSKLCITGNVSIDSMKGQSGIEYQRIKIVAHSIRKALHVKEDLFTIPV